MPDEEKKPIHILRERRGPVPKALTEQVRRHREVKRAIGKALAEGPQTVPQLAEATGLPTDEVFWHVISMRKYGQVAEGEKDGQYFQYVLQKKAKE